MRGELSLEPVVYYKKGTVKVYGEIYSGKIDPTCPKIPRRKRVTTIIKVPLKHIIMRPPRHQQRYEAAWVMLVDKKTIEAVCLSSYEDTMRFFIEDGVHRCHAVYDAGYDYIPAFVMLKEQEPEGLKECKTFDNQPRNVFERMQLPANIVPEKCQHRPKWQVKEDGASVPFVCNWCGFKPKCFKELVGSEISEFEFPDS